MTIVILFQTSGSGISSIDSTAIKVCHNLRIKSNKVFRELAKLGKTSAGWFYGFKVHLVISDRGDLLAVMITPDNIDDRKPVPRFAKRLFGKLFGDRGYISKELFALLWEHVVQLIAKIKKNLPATIYLVLLRRTHVNKINAAAS